MSVIVRCPDSGNLKLLCKGADSVILQRLAADSPNNQQVSKLTQEYLETYASSGLRTLLFAERELTESEYQKFDEDYRKAQGQMVKREEKMNEVADAFEN